MRGNTVDLKEIVLGENPEAVDLHCEEVLQDEVEEEQQVHEPIVHELYEVSICCGFCHRPIKFACRATISSIRDLQSLLLGPFDFLCVKCVNEKKLNHGG